MTKQPTYNPVFANYATRVAFDIRLTRAQIWYLSVIAELYHAKGSKRSLDGARGARLSDIPCTNTNSGTRNGFVPTCDGLRGRGLVEHYSDVLGNAPGQWSARKQPPWYWRLTPAGEHVYSLLKIAGLAANFAVSNDVTPTKKQRAA